jgi:hypothetical protein
MVVYKFEELILIYRGWFEHLRVRGGHGARGGTLGRNRAREEEIEHTEEEIEREVGEDRMCKRKREMVVVEE